MASTEIELFSEQWRGLRKRTPIYHAIHFEFAGLKSFKFLSNYLKGTKFRELDRFAKFNYNSKSCKIGARNARKLSFCGQFAKLNSRENVIG